MSHDSQEDDDVDSHNHTHKEEEDTFLQQQPFYRPRRFRHMHTCGYIAVALLSLLLGLFGAQFMRIEYDIDGYIGSYTFVLSLVVCWLFTE